MFKLVKFEFLRKRKVFSIAAVLTILGQVYALYNYYRIDEATRGYIGDEVFAVFVGVLLVVFSLVFFIDIIFLFKDDLFKQEGYMLFMTPFNGYKLLGAKLIFALLEGIVIATFYSILFYINYKIMDVGPIDFSFLGGNSEWIFAFVKVLVLGVFMILEFALTVYLSFALFKSLFNNTRFKGLITFLIFIVINVFKSKIVNMIANLIGTNIEPVYLNSGRMLLESLNTSINFGLVASLVSSILLFIGTGYLLDKRINL